MPTVRVTNLSGINLKVNPLNLKDGDMLRCVNVVNDFYGAKKKRPGYITYLGTPDNNQVNSLFNWTRNDGTTFWNYRYSGSILYYSTQGTGAWTVCGNGTMTNAARIGNAVLEDTMIIGDGAAATRHTTNGTSFTNTTSAPIANYFTDYQNRIWAGGTASNLFYSTTGTPTNWTADSSSIAIPGAGKINSVFKANDRVNVGKNSGAMFRYDGYNLVDLATNLNTTSAWSIGNSEDYRLWLNRLGIFGYGGGKPQLLSNAIERQIYNDLGSAIVGGNFETAPGVVHRYDYLLSAGTITDDLTNETINNCVIKYDYQLNEFSNFSLAVNPTAWLSYKDGSGNQQLVFGDVNGQCYTQGGTSLNDNGTPVTSVMEFLITGGMPETEKKWNYLWMFFNPGCQAKIQIALTNTFIKGSKVWVDVGDVSDGVAEIRFPGSSESKLMFVKIVESSRNARFNFYGFAYDADPLTQRR